jgi:ABC-type branched-subunit amino acid transport system ATPase component
VSARGYVLETGSITLTAPSTQLRADPHIQRAYLPSSQHPER